jgi:hypothetical protein
MHHPPFHWIALWVQFTSFFFFWECTLVLCVCVCMLLCLKNWAKFNLLLEFQLILCTLKLTFFSGILNL